MKELEISSSVLLPIPGSLAETFELCIYIEVTRADLVKLQGGQLEY